MNERDQLREQMWDLIYGLSTAEESAALSARIRSDHKVARLYAEVRLQADLVGQAAKVEDVSVTLPEVEPRRERVAAGRAKETSKTAASGGGGTTAALHWLATAAASALAILLAVGTLWPGKNPPQRQIYLVTIENRDRETLIAGIPVKLSVQAHDVHGNPAELPLLARLENKTGRVLYEQDVRTSESGAADLSVPGEAIDEPVSLKVYHRSGRAQAEQAPPPAAPAEQVAGINQQEELLLDAVLPVQQQPVETYVTFDKEWYEAGEAVNFRYYQLAAFTHQNKTADPATVRLVMPDGNDLAPAEAQLVDSAGVVTGEFQLPPDAQAGRYEFTVPGGTGEPRPEAFVAVGRETAQLEGIQNLYLLYSHALRARESGVDRTLGMGKEAKQSGSGSLPALGPGGFGGGLAEEKREMAPGLAGSSLKQQTRGPTGAARPSAAGQEAATADAAPPAPSSAPAGPKATPAPVAPDVLALKDESETAGARSDRGRVDKLAKVESEFFKREAGKGVAEQDGETVEVPIPREAQGKSVLVEARYRGLMLGKAAVLAEDKLAEKEKLTELAADDEASRKVPIYLHPNVDGDVDLFYFDNSVSPPKLLAKRSLARQPRSDFDIALGDARDSYAPGEKVRFVVQVTDKESKIQASQVALGLSVAPTLEDDVAELELRKKLAQLPPVRAHIVDGKGDAVTQRSPADAKPDLSRRKMEANEAPSLDKLPRKEAANMPLPVPAGALGGFGRGGAPGGGPAPAAPASGSGVEPQLQLEGRFAVPEGAEQMAQESGAALQPEFDEYKSQLRISNEEQVKQVLQEQEKAQAAHQAGFALWRARLGRWLLIGGVVMLGVLAVAFAVQRPAKARLWIPALAIAAASFVVGFMWLLGQPRHPVQQVAQGLPAGDTLGDGAETARPMARTSTPRESQATILSESEVRDAPARAPAPGADSAPLSEQVAQRERGKPGEGTFSDTEIGQRQKDQFGREVGRTFDPKQAKQFPAPAEKKPLDEAAGETKAPPSGKGASLSLQPDAAVKAAMPAREADKARLGAGTAENKDRKDAAARDGSDKRVLRSELEKAEKMRANEPSKNGQRAGVLFAEGKKGVEDQTKRLKDAKKLPQTIVWQPVLMADENGQAVIEFTMPEVPGKYRLLLDVHGAGRVGQLAKEIRCQVPQPASPAKP